MKITCENCQGNNVYFQGAENFSELHSELEREISLVCRDCDFIEPYTIKKINLDEEGDS